MITEADTCRKYLLPKLTTIGWDTAPHSFTEQKTFTDGRILLGQSTGTAIGGLNGQKIRKVKLPLISVQG